MQPREDSRPNSEGRERKHQPSLSERVVLLKHALPPSLIESLRGSCTKLPDERTFQESETVLALNIVLGEEKAGDFIRDLRNSGDGEYAEFLAEYTRNHRQAADAIPQQELIIRTRHLSTIVTDVNLSAHSQAFEDCLEHLAQLVEQLPRLNQNQDLRREDIVSATIGLIRGGRYKLAQQTMAENNINPTNSEAERMGSIVAATCSEFAGGKRKEEMWQAIYQICQRATIHFDQDQAQQASQRLKEKARLAGVFEAPKNDLLDAQVRQSHRQRLGQELFDKVAGLQSETAQALLARVNDRGLESRDRYAAAIALSTKPERNTVAAALVAAMRQEANLFDRNGLPKDGSDFVRLKCAGSGLADIDNSPVIRDLLLGLQGDYGIAFSAATVMALRFSNSARILDGIGDVLSSGSNIAKIYSLRTLAGNQHPAAVKLFIDFGLASRDPEIIQNAFRLLQIFRPESEQLDNYLRGLQSGRDPVRQTLASAVPAAGDPEQFKRRLMITEYEGIALAKRVLLES